MITNVPTPNDFADQGTTFLNLAWDTVFDLVLEYADAEEWNAIAGDDQTDDYWQAAQKPLGTAVALAQQGAEFLLKAGICETSPFLLISGKAAEWPSKCDKQNTSFSSFHTADAQDLVRIHDTVAKRRFSGPFKELFDRLRRTRNTVFHTVDRTMRFSEKEIVTAILEISEELLGQQQWTRIRRDYLESTPGSVAWSGETVGLRLSREMLSTVDLLGNAHLRRLLGFNKNQRRYVCPECTMEWSSAHRELKPNTAQLDPNTPSSTNVHCFVCRKDFNVIRMPCRAKGCKGNVIHADVDNECLTCFESNDIEQQ